MLPMPLVALSPKPFVSTEPVADSVILPFDDEMVVLPFGLTSALLTITGAFEVTNTEPRSLPEKSMPNALLALTEFVDVTVALVTYRYCHQACALPSS